MNAERILELATRLNEDQARARPQPDEIEKRLAVLREQRDILAAALFEVDHEIHAARNAVDEMYRF